MEVTCLEIAAPRERARYDALFEDCPGAFIQQSSYWADVIAELGPDLPILLVCSEQGDDIAGLPLYLFRPAEGAILTSVPQPGPLGGVFAREGLGRERLERAYRLLLGEALALASSHGCLALTLISSPFQDDLPLYERALEPTYVFENFTQYVPLGAPARRSGGQRNNVARARRFGFRVERGGAQHLARWYELHGQRHRDVGAEPLPRRLFENVVRELIPRGKALLLTAWDGDRLAAGCLYVGHRRVLDVYAISMDSAYAAHAPNALLAEASLAWAREAGFEVYNWQSSRSRADGVYENKRQWGSREAPYFFVTRLLVDASRIEALGADRVRTVYAGHYLVPFGVFQHGAGQRYFRKD